VLGCASGTDALLIPLMAKGIGRGDAVFVPSFTFAATAEVVALTGAEPVFVDIDPDTYNMDPAFARRGDRDDRGGRPPAAEGDHPGRPVRSGGDYVSISTRSPASTAFWSFRTPRRRSAARRPTSAAAFGDVASTSFYPAKPLGCYGDGGAVMTDDDDLAEVMRSVAFHGKGEASTTMCASA
jgi:dTDP-4-amino-4,6-dideoxygalactose transaminase